MMTKTKPQHFSLEPGTRLIVRVLQDVLRTRTFTDYSDLVETLKCRCANLRIPYDSGRVCDAIDQLERGGRTPIVARPRPRRLVERRCQAVNDILTKADAGRLARELLARFRGAA